MSGLKCRIVKKGGGKEMGNAERRLEILKLLCRRRYEKLENLASEFGVSKRTISRDIEYLSLKNPIYTQAGKIIFKKGS